MTIKYQNKAQLLSLKAKIKGLAEEGRRTRKFIAKSEGDRKYYYLDQKRSIGMEARYHLIAYGLLLGKDYKEIEPKANPDKLSSWLFDYNYLAQIILQHCVFDKSKWTPANLQCLLTTGSIAIAEVA